MVGSQSRKQARHGIAPVTAYTSNEADSVIPESKQQACSDEHNRPTPLSFLLVQLDWGLDALVLCNISCPGSVETFSDAGQFCAGSQNHDGEQRVCKAFQQVHQTLAKDKSNDELQQTEEDDAGARPCSKAKLGS